MHTWGGCRWRGGATSPRRSAPTAGQGCPLCWPAASAAFLVMPSPAAPSPLPPPPLLLLLLLLLPAAARVSNLGSAPRFFSTRHRRRGVGPVEVSCSSTEFLARPVARSVAISGWPWTQQADGVHHAPVCGGAVVAGPSGVGKSSLLNALSSPAAAPGHGQDSHRSASASSGEDGGEGSSAGGSSTRDGGGNGIGESGSDGIRENGSNGIRESGSDGIRESGSNSGGRAEWSAFQRGGGGRGMSAPASAAAQITIGDEIGDIQVPFTRRPPRPSACYTSKAITVLLPLYSLPAQ